MNRYQLMHLATVCLALSVCQSPLRADQQTRLVDRTYRMPLEAHVQRYRDAMSHLDLEPTILDRFAYRCQAFIYDDRDPESFLSIHAVDRKLDATRHIVRRRFTDEDDPRLLFSIERDGYGDTRTGDEDVFPISHDRLRVQDKVFFTDNPAEGVDRKQVRISGQDRNFNPVTCSLLPLSSFFEGGISKQRISSLYPIPTLKPEGVSVEESSMVVRHPIKVDGQPTANMMFVEFDDELPVSFEIWRIVGEKQELIFRTTTQWKVFGEVRLPVRIEAFQRRRYNDTTVAFAADLEWKFNRDVPQRLFQVGDVTSRFALDWD